MAINFEQTTKGKVGDIIYPAYNGTNGFWKVSRWDVVVKIDSKRNIIERKFVYDFATIKAIELIKKFPEIIHKTKNAKGEKE